MGPPLTAFIRAMASPGIGWLIANAPSPNMASVLESPMRSMGHRLALEPGVLPDAFWSWSWSLATHTDTMRGDRDLIRCLATWRGARPDAMFREEDLRTITQPTLLFWGTEDPFGGAAAANDLAAVLPDATVHMVEGGGHLTWLDVPAQAAEVGAAFLGSAS
jgi:pimeloyl-ACP methyl ester carboxylesterase